MRRTSIPARIISLSSRFPSLLLGALLPATAAAQDGVATNPGTAQGNDDRMQGLPAWLLPVPGGEVALGITAKELLEVKDQVAPYSPQDQDKVLRKVASALGETRVRVQPFLLGKTPVTNAQYLVYVKATGRKFPYHWWYDGERKHYESKLEEINKEFSGLRGLAPLYYWERHFKDLPYKLANEKGESIADQPVVFVSWRDAMRYAAWLGMRLPTEAEWTRAARGDGENLWLWGRKDHQDFEALGDAYREKVLERLRIKNAKDQNLKPAGAVGAFAMGPYGHLDMVGQVWEWMGPLGYLPLCGKQAFDAEFKKLLRDKVGGRLEHPPLWKEAHAVLKGGCYFSWQDPEDLLIDARAPRPTVETRAGAGFRLAKSFEPGRDLLHSLVSSGYNQAPFAPNQTPYLEDQIGIERYELNAEGNPTSYHAVSFAPVNWLSDEKGFALRKLGEKSHAQPVVIGTLATSVPLEEPALPPGIYTVYYRESGMPRELETALREGYKVVQEDLRRKEKGLEPRPAEDGSEWRAVLAKYGIDEKELEEKEAHTKIKHVRLKPNDFEVSTQQNLFLFSNDPDLEFVAATEARITPRANSSYEGAHLKLDVSKSGKERLSISFGVPIEERSRTRVGGFMLPVTLTTAPATGEKAWRLPDRAEVVAQGSNGGANNQVVKKKN